MSLLLKENNVNVNKKQTAFRSAPKQQAHWCNIIAGKILGVNITHRITYLWEVGVRGVQ